MLTIVYAGSLAALALLIALSVAYNRGYQRRERELTRERDLRTRDRLAHIAAPGPVSPARRDYADARALHLVPIGKANRS